MEKLKCPRCNRPTKGNNVTIQGVVFGPECGRVVSKRQRLRESMGSGEKTLRECKVSGKGFYAKPESDDICPETTCSVCKYNTVKFVSVELCPLEVENRQRELAKWK